MRKMVKVQEINKYQKVFYGELGIYGTDFLNNLKYIFHAENVG